VVQGARKTKSMSDYAVGSVQFSPYMVGLSLAAASTSAATFIINPGFITLYGISGVIAFAIFMPLGKYLSLIFMTKRFRKQGINVKAISMAQWIGRRYDTKFGSMLFAILSLLLVSFMVLICVGMTKVISQALQIGEITALTGIVVFVFGYMMFGGANSMIYTNTIQAFMKLIVAVILLSSGYAYFSEGIHHFVEQLNQIDPLLTATTNPKSPLFRDYFEIIFCPFVIGIAIVCQPHIITKSLLLRGDEDVNKYLFAGILAEIIFFSVVFVGLYARLSFPDLMNNGVAMKMDGIIPAYVVKEFPVWLGLVVVFGLISSGLATFEGLIQSLSTTITTDILSHFGFGLSDVGSATPTSETPNPKWLSLMVLNKIVIIGLAILTFFLTKEQLLNPKLSVGIFAQLGVYAFFSAAFMPVVMGIFLKNVPTVAPITAAIAAVIVHFGTYFGSITPYLQGAVKNPAVSATYAILTATVIGFGLYFWSIVYNKTL
jgi:sodium/pantothenate symporter